MYYALNGKNGVGVFDDYGKLYKNLNYIFKPRVKGFDSYSEALDYALLLYDEAQNDFDCKFDPDDVMDMQINYFYYKNQIRKKHLEKYHGI